MYLPFCLETPFSSSECVFHCHSRTAKRVVGTSFEISDLHVLCMSLMSQGISGYAESPIKVQGLDVATLYHLTDVTIKKRIYVAPLVNVMREIENIRS